MRELKGAERKRLKIVIDQLIKQEDELTNKLKSTQALLKALQIIYETGVTYDDHSN